jgi:cytochrome c-type biogenesis protein CcmH/NrfG
MVYGVAGMIFGFVIGYMAANAGAPAPAAASGPAVASGAPSSFAPAPSKPSLDPNEVRALESLARRDPKNVQARVELANLLMDHEQFEAAARWYDEALALDPQNADVRIDMGACLVSAGKPAEAIPVFDLALKQQPGHKKALFNKGVALMHLGRNEEAVALWEGLLKRYPDDPQLQTLRERIREVRATTGAAKP